MKSRKRLLLIALMCWAIVSCQDSDEKNVISEKLDASVGEKIPYATAVRWLGNLEKQNTEGRANVGAQSVSKQNLDKLLMSQPDLIGLAFHYGIDDAGLQHVLVIPVGQSKKLWTGETQALILDAKSDQIISEETGSIWAERFQQQNKDDIWFHFFGKNIFNQVGKYETFSLKQASNDDGVLQLLLFAYQKESANGRTADDDTPIVIDMSNPCPPCTIIN